MRSRRIRVAQVLEATVGGARKHVLDLCRGLDRDEFEIHALISNLRDPEPDTTRRTLEDAGVAVTVVPMRRGLAPIANLGSLVRISAHLRSWKPDIVHAHSAIGGVLGRLAAARNRVKGTIYTPHGFPFCMSDQSAMMRDIFRGVESWLGRHTSRIVAVCAGERQTALDSRVASPEQCMVIPNGVTFRDPPVTDRQSKLRELSLPEDAQVILCVGDLRAQKGHVHAIDALPPVLRKHPKVHLLIAGEGEERERIQRRAESRGVSHRVHLPGWRGDVPELLVACDIFCQPSLWEGCPYALIEAGSMGCGVVGSDIPGVADIVRHGETGWLAAPADAQDLARQLIEALDRADLRDQCGQRLNREVREQYSLEQMVRRTAELYVEVFEETREA